MTLHNLAIKAVALALTVAVLLLMVACSGLLSSPTLDDSNSKDFTENQIIENTITETTIQEIITEEIYLSEILEVEEKISELLLQEDRIEEVLLCKTVYVNQERIEEFSENSQMAKMFGDGIELAPLLKKIAIGTGVIITLTVLSVSGLSGPVASIVSAAAPAALEGALIGAGIGTVLGGLTGVADEIDETGRTSAIIGFSAAVVGLVITTMSAVAAIPSGGSTAAGVVFGIKVAVAGISLAATGYAGYNMVKTLTTTDAKEIDWGNVDWNRIGISAAEQSINGAANGYVWGSIIGAVEGGAEGLKYYETYGTPYSRYNARIQQTPKDGNSGHWTGERGESTFVLDEPLTCKNGTVVKEISYKNGVPDFSKYSLRQVKIARMTDNRSSNFKQADEVLAEYWSKIKFESKTWTARDVSNYRASNGLTWHEMNNMETMQLVPTEINATFGHLGGVGEFNAMTGRGGSDFD